MQAISEGYQFNSYNPSSNLESGLYYAGKTVKVVISTAFSIADLALQAIHILAITIISALDHIESHLTGNSITYSKRLEYFYLFIITLRVFTKDHLLFIDEKLNCNLSNLSDKYFDFWTK